MVHLLKLQCSSSVHILLLLFSTLILTSSMEVAFSDARRLPLRLQAQGTGGSGGTNKAVAADNKHDEAAARSRGGGGTETEGRRRGLIGSRPPKCERVCMSCGHCEAVQVPIVPQEGEEKEKEKARAASASAVTLAAAVFTYQVDGITSYKPLSWKCKCGGTILDP